MHISEFLHEINREAQGAHGEPDQEKERQREEIEQLRATLEDSRAITYWKAAKARESHARAAELADECADLRSQLVEAKQEAAHEKSVRAAIATEKATVLRALREQDTKAEAYRSAIRERDETISGLRNALSDALRKAKGRPSAEEQNRLTRELANYARHLDAAEAEKQQLRAAVREIRDVAQRKLKITTPPAPHKENEE